MKHTSHRSLNELFREAAERSAAEANGNVPTPNDIEQLLRNPVMHSVPVTRTLGQRLYESLLSSPLKIGMTAMTTAATIALGVFAFWPQNAQQKISPTATSTNLQFHQTDKPTSADSRTQDLMSWAPKTILAEHTSSTGAILSEAVPSELIATADSLHPIDISPDQLAKLGIVLEDNGDIDFYTKDGNEINRFGMPPTWGMRLHLGETFSDEQLAGLIIQKSAPRLITEPDGSKRLFSFESDTTINEKNGDRITMLKMQNQMRIAPGATESHASNNGPFAVEMYKINNKGKGTEVDVSSDTVAPGHSLVNSTVKVVMNDSELTPEIRKVMKSVNVDSILATINLDSIMSSINMDSIVASVHPDLRRKNMDSIMRAANLAVKNVKKIISSMHIDLDTGNSHAALQVEVNTNNDEVNNDQYNSGTIKLSNGGAVSNGVITDVRVDSGSSVNVKTRSGNTVQLYGRRMDVNLDSGESANISTQIKKSIQVTVNGDDSDNSDIDEDIPVPPVPPIPPFHQMEQMMNSLDLSKLIPIRVVNNKNPEHPNELIFWYDATPEVQAALPHEPGTASVSEVATKSMSVSVYPNPTVGPLTVNYRLTNAPKAHFVVHNLLGQVVMDGGWSADASGEEALDLSQLPAGVYLLVTTTDTGDRDVERVVVAK